MPRTEDLVVCAFYILVIAVAGLAIDGIRREFDRRDGSSRLAAVSSKLALLKPYLPVLFYFAVSLFVLGPLLKPGYVFYLERSLGPNYRVDFSAPAANGFSLSLLIYAATRVLPAWLVQKVLLFLCLFIAGLAMHKTVPVRGRWPRYFAGLLYMINPFVFVRLQAGHIGFLLAYSLAPLVLAYAVKQAEKPTVKKGVAAGLWLAGVTLIDYHGLYLLIPYILIMVINLYFKKAESGALISFAKSLGASAASFRVRMTSSPLTMTAPHLAL